MLLCLALCLIIPYRLVEQIRVANVQAEVRRVVSLLLHLGLGVDVAQHGDVGEVDPEFAEQRGHPARRRTELIRLRLGARNRPFYPCDKYKSAAVVLSTCMLACWGSLGADTRRKGPGC